MTPLKKVIAALNRGANSLRKYATDTIEAGGKDIKPEPHPTTFNRTSYLGTRKSGNATVTATRNDVYIRDDTVGVTDGVPLYKRESGNYMQVITSTSRPNSDTTTSEHYHPQGRYRFLKTNVSSENRPVDDDSGKTPSS